MKRKVIALVLITALVATSVAACGKKPKRRAIDDDDEDEVETVDTTESTEDSASSSMDSSVETSSQDSGSVAILFEDSSKPVVYSAVTEEDIGYKYEIPYINISSDDAKSINSEMNNLLQPKITEDLEQRKDEANYYENIVYSSYINGSTLSLLITAESVDDVDEHWVYNIDISTGKKITNDDIRKMKGLDDSSYLNLLKEKFIAKFYELFGSRDEYEDSVKEVNQGLSAKEIADLVEFYDEQYECTVSADNYSLTTPLFIGSNGNACVIGDIYSVAGADCYEHIIDLGV